MNGNYEKKCTIRLQYCNFIVANYDKNEKRKLIENASE